MKRSETQRSAILVEALQAMDGHVLPSMERSDPKGSWCFYGMRLGTADISLGGGDDFGGVNDQAWLDIDIETARLLMPLLRKLIEDELAKLGVEP